MKQLEKREFESDFMKQIVRQEIKSLGGSPVSINLGNKNNQGCYVEMLVVLKSQLDAMLVLHKHVIMVRVDIRPPHYTHDNKLMSDFMRKLRKKLRRKDEKLVMGFMWAREVERAKKQHYHLVLLLDHRVFRNANYVIHHCIEPICEGWDWPKPYTPKHCYYIIKRGDQASYEKAFYRASYLCKIRGKGYKAKTANDYGRSNVQAK